MALQANHKMLLKRELVLTAIFIVVGLLLAFVLSKSGWGCTIDTPGGCSTTSDMENFLFALAGIMYFLALMVMPLVILITVMYSLLVLRKLRK